MVPELGEPIHSRLSSSHSNSAEVDAIMMTKNKNNNNNSSSISNINNKQWRPRSAPKTSNARSASPFQLWAAKRGEQPHVVVDKVRGQDAAATADFFGAAGRDSEDATYVDSVSNHLGKMTPPTRPGSGDPPPALPPPPNGRREVVKNAMDVEKRGPHQAITREEYESLPQAIQRKVCLPWIFVGIFFFFSLFLFSGRGVDCARTRGRRSLSCLHTQQQSTCHLFSAFFLLSQSPAVRIAYSALFGFSPRPRCLWSSRTVFFLFQKNKPNREQPTCPCRQRRLSASVVRSRNIPHVAQVDGLLRQQQASCRDQGDENPETCKRAPSGACVLLLHIYHEEVAGHTLAVNGQAGV